MRAAGKFVDFLLISLGFVGALAVYNTFFQGGLGVYETMLGTGASVLAFWAAVEFRNGSIEEPVAGWVRFLETFCVGTGVNLLLHAFLTYAFYIRRTPFLIVQRWCSCLRAVDAADALGSSKVSRRALSADRLRFDCAEDIPAAAGAA